MLKSFVIAGSLILAGPAAAQSTGRTSPAAEAGVAEQRQAIAQTVERGRQLFALSRAGALATQDMLSRVPNAEATGVSGWIAEPQGNAMVVTFYADTAEGPVAAYRGTVLGGRVTARDLYPADSRPPLMSTAKRMAAARAATDALDNRVCASDQPFNVLVVPPANADAPIHVYQLTPMLERTAAPLGGHYRTTVNADGSVAQRETFGATCQDLQVPPAAGGRATRALEITEAGLSLPNEIHVLTSLMTGRPLVVRTGSDIWGVTGEGIGELRQRRSPAVGR